MARNTLESADFSQLEVLYSLPYEGTSAALEPEPELPGGDRLLAHTRQLLAHQGSDAELLQQVLLAIAAIAEGCR